MLIEKLTDKSDFDHAKTLDKHGDGCKNQDDLSFRIALDAAVNANVMMKTIKDTGYFDE
jgi:hypothetical protein